MNGMQARGFLVPHEKLRPKIVPQDDDDEDDQPACGGAVCNEETRTGKIVRRPWVSWATLLLPVFAVDVFDCPSCHGRMQRIAFITHSRIIQQLLDCVNRKPQPP
jgi:hypothetical protein